MRHFCRTPTHSATLSITDAAIVSMHFWAVLAQPFGLSLDTQRPYNNCLLSLTNLPVKSFLPNREEMSLIFVSYDIPRDWYTNAIQYLRKDLSCPSIYPVTHPPTLHNLEPSLSLSNSLQGLECVQFTTQYTHLFAPPFCTISLSLSTNSSLRMQG